MNASIKYLEVALKTLKENEAIHRAEGRTEEADFEAQSIVEIEEGIKTLVDAENK